MSIFIADGARADVVTAAARTLPGINEMFAWDVETVPGIYEGYAVAIDIDGDAPDIEKSMPGYLKILRATLPWQIATEDELEAKENVTASA